MWTEEESVNVATCPRGYSMGCAGGPVTVMADESQRETRTVVTGSNVMKRVVVVVEAPLSYRDFDRFGIATFPNYDLQPEIWEIHDVYAPRPRSERVVRPTDVKIRRFASEYELVRTAATLKAVDCVIATAGVYHGQEEATAPFVEAISSSDALFTAVSSGHTLPMPMPPSANRGRFERPRRVAGAIARDLKSHPRRVPVNLRRSWRRRRPFRNSRSQALDAIWAGTNVDGIQTRLIDQDTKLHFIHTLDYDLVRNCRRQPPGLAVGKIVYLDSMGPEHPDFLVQGWNLASSAAGWFSSVRAAFDHIETALQLPVAIAPHPRTSRNQALKWYGEREVLSRLTAQSIRDSEFVLVTDPTTSLGMVAALQRPCLGLRAPLIHARSHAEFQVYTDSLGIPVIDHDSVPQTLARPLPDINRQARFVEDYVKRAGTPDQDFWEVVASRIATWDG